VAACVVADIDRRLFSGLPGPFERAYDDCNAVCKLTRRRARDTPGAKLSFAKSQRDVQAAPTVLAASGVKNPITSLAGRA
jgi:hypothetical protein